MSLKPQGPNKKQPTKTLGWKTQDGEGRVPVSSSGRRFFFVVMSTYWFIVWVLRSELKRATHLHPAQPVSALMTRRETSSVVTSYETEMRIASTAT